MALRGTVTNRSDLTLSRRRAAGARAACCAWASWRPAPACRSQPAADRLARQAGARRTMCCRPVAIAGVAGAAGYYPPSNYDTTIDDILGNTLLLQRPRAVPPLFAAVVGDRQLRRQRARQRRVPGGLDRRVAADGGGGGRPLSAPWTRRCTWSTLRPELELSERHGGHPARADDLDVAWPQPVGPRATPYDMYAVPGRGLRAALHAVAGGAL